MAKKITYRANEVAWVHLVGKPKTRLTAKIKNGWANIYHGKTLIWSCNSHFFKAHFVKETTAKKSKLLLVSTCDIIIDLNTKKVLKSRYNFPEYAIKVEDGILYMYNKIYEGMIK